jgi:spoIIIJ-associated protein
VVRDILNRMGLTADISAVRLGSRLVLNLDGPDKALLIGTRGATLEALQLLAAKIVARQNPAAGRLVLDVADYRARRQSHILENLRQVAETVRRTRQPQNMPGLNAAEKRLAQRALRPFKDLSARTEGGRGGLVIAPAAAVPKPRPKSRRRTAEPA